MVIMDMDNLYISIMFIIIYFFVCVNKQMAAMVISTVKWSLYRVVNHGSRGEELV